MSLFKSLHSLPIPLLFLIGLIPAVPLFSLFLFDIEFLLRHNPIEFLLVIVAYWLFPLIIVTAALRRNFLLIPFFYLECVLLVSHLLVMKDLEAHQLQLLRFGLLGIMTLFTVFFLNKDVLYPLLSGSHRSWRSAPRLYINMPMLLWYHNDHSKLPVVLHNCSLVGIGISGLKSQFTPILAGKNELASFVIHIGYGGKSWMLTVKLVRIREEASTLYAGLRVLNSEVMHDLIREIETVIPAEKNLKDILANYWVRKGFRHAVLVLWASSMMSLMAIPGCTKKIGPSGSSPGPVQMTKVQPLIQ